MPAKRSRPISNDTSDANIIRRRALGRARQQRLRNQQRQQHPRQPNSLPSEQQLQQGERIVDLSTTQEEDAAVTLIQLGLRVQGVTLAQDPVEVQLQHDALPIDEHETVYHSGAASTLDIEDNSIQQLEANSNIQRSTSRAISNSSSGALSQSRQQDLSHFFRSLPP